MKQVFFLFIASLFLFSCGNKKKEVAPQIDSSKHPEWSYGATIYEVNVRQYTKEGTFEAFSKEIPRLKELGVDILWFMPIQPIGKVERKGTLGSYYSIQDYKAVNPEFGKMQDFQKVVKLAHDNGMKVIMDWVANHTSRDAVWLQQHPDWYMKDSLGKVIAPFDWTDVAELDYSKKEMRAEMINAMSYWLKEANLDGFRCDVAGEIPTDFWLEAKDALLKIQPSLFMLSEYEKPELNEKAFDAFYTWDFFHKMNDVAQGKSGVDSLRVAYNKIQTNFPKHAMPMFFTSNHDENSWNGTEFERMGKAAPTFAALTFMMPGIPLIYNGQEVGFNRRLQFFEKDLIDWKENKSFTDLYAMLVKFRKSNVALHSPEKGGTFQEIKTDKPSAIWAFKRVKDANEIVCVFNLSNAVQKVKFDNTIFLNHYKRFGAAEIPENLSELELQPWEYLIYYK